MANKGQYVRVYLTPKRLEALQHWRDMVVEGGGNGAYNALLGEAVEEALVERGFLIRVVRPTPLRGEGTTHTEILVGRIRGTVGEEGRYGLEPEAETEPILSENPTRPTRRRRRDRQQRTE